jgi:hypothetical protein
MAGAAAILAVVGRTRPLGTREVITTGGPCRSRPRRPELWRRVAAASRTAPAGTAVWSGVTEDVRVLVLPERAINPPTLLWHTSCRDTRGRSESCRRVRRSTVSAASHPRSAARVNRPHETPGRTQCRGEMPTGWNAKGPCDNRVPVSRGSGRVPAEPHTPAQHEERRSRLLLLHEGSGLGTGALE